MDIEYYVKSVYGKDTYYIKDKKIAKLIGQLTGKKTVSVHDIDALLQLGHSTMEVVRPRPCPACDEYKELSALSRYCKESICSACGLKEALKGWFWN